MKRGTPNHPKTIDLAGKLGIPRWGAAGLLESLWHFAAQYAKRGDLGRRTDTAIAQWIGWEGDPAILIDAYCAAGWVDRCPCHRLRVHDWPEHADQSVERSEEVKKLGFIDCYGDASLKLENSSFKLENSSLPLPLPKPFKRSSAAPAAATTTLPLQLEAVPSVQAVTRVITTATLVPWSQEAGEMWVKRFGGTASYGAIGHALKPLVAEHGWDLVRPAWAKYLAEAEGKYASPSRFANTFGEWSGLSPPARASPGRTSGDRTMAALAKFKERREHGEGHGKGAEVHGEAHPPRGGLPPGTR